MILSLHAVPRHCYPSGDWVGAPGSRLEPGAWASLRNVGMMRKDMFKKRELRCIKTPPKV